MVITFWGVRGSMPSPGPDTVRYGGNTACVSVESGDDILVIDAGTGIRLLGKSLVGKSKRIFLVLSHLHYDHVLGFPLFAPLFEEGRSIYLIGCPADGGVWTPLSLMDGVYWPVTPNDLRSDTQVVGDEGFSMLAEGGMTVDRMRVNHPGGAFGYRVSDGSKSFVHVTDNELRPPGEAECDFGQMVEFCRGVDVLSHDAQYLEREMPFKEGWGHSLTSAACELAIKAEVRSLVLFHHDPDRSDTALDRIGQDAREMVEPHGIEAVVAYEGLRLDLDRHDRSTVQDASKGEKK